MSCSTTRYGRPPFYVSNSTYEKHYEYTDTVESGSDSYYSDGNNCE